MPRNFPGYIHLLGFVLLTSCSANTTAVYQNIESSEKINGASLVASRRPIEDTEFIHLCDLAVSYVSLLPFAYVREGQPAIHYNAGFQWWGEKPEGIAKCIELAHKHGMKVMIKPQLWLSNGEYTGQLDFDSEEKWKEFETSYTAYIFQLLQVANSYNAELFCIGTELDMFVKKRKPYWSALIDSIRKQYDGKITYAENWDCYDDFPFWDKLDLIGVNAYFPLSEAATPSLEDLSEKWNAPFLHMKSFSEKMGKPVLFTEYGYRSIDYATRKPWESYIEGNVNQLAQKNAYEALYIRFWKEPWFAGGFLWKWFDEHTSPDVSFETDYTPQNKQALDVIRKYYTWERP